jgi:glycogen debranching enzyme
METGIAPKEKAIALLDKIRQENVGEWGPYLAANERNAMMTISTGVQAVAEAKYGRINEALWYVDKIVQTFNRVLPGSISEMMPDYGDFTQAWTSYGIIVPLIEYVFGIQPDAYAKTIVFEPQIPQGWNDVSIQNLPVNSNLISFSKTESTKGIDYSLKATESNWKMILKIKDSPGAKYFLNEKEVPFSTTGFQMTQTTNHLLITQ